VLDRRLPAHEYVADDYSIADIFDSGRGYCRAMSWQTVDLNQYPNVKRWYLAIVQRPAVQRGYHRAGEGARKFDALISEKKLDVTKCDV